MLTKSIKMNPEIRMGLPVVSNTDDMTVEEIALLWWTRKYESLEVLIHSYPLIDEHAIIIACWYAGTHGSPQWRNRFGSWLTSSRPALMVGKDVVLPPQLKAGTRPVNRPDWDTLLDKDLNTKNDIELNSHMHLNDKKFQR